MSIAVYHANMNLRKFARSVKQTMRLCARNAVMHHVEFSPPLPVSPKEPMGHQPLSPVPVAHVPAVPQQPAVTVINHIYCCSYNTSLRYSFSPEYDERNYSEY
jgi:hypothetical protein